MASIETLTSPVKPGILPFCGQEIDLSKRGTFLLKSSGAVPFRVLWTEAMSWRLFFTHDNEKRLWLPPAGGVLVKFPAAPGREDPWRCIVTAPLHAN